MPIERGIPGLQAAETAPVSRDPGRRPVETLWDHRVEILATLLPWCWFVLRDLGWVFDPAAIALPVIGLAFVLVLAVSGLIMRRRWMLLGAASTALLGLAVVIGPWIPQSSSAPRQPTTVLAANLTAVTGEPFASELWPTILAEDSDILVLSEFNGELTELVGESYEYALLSNLAQADLVGDESGTQLNRAFVGVFSRLPVERLPDNSQLDEGLPGLRVRVEGPAGPFILYALHLPKPSAWSDGFSASFHSRNEVIRVIADLIEAESLPVVVAGDLNLSDRESMYRELTGSLRDAMRQGVWAGPTSVKQELGWGLLALRIDHVLVSEPWCADGGDRIPLPLSDHRAVVASVGPCR